MSDANVESPNGNNPLENYFSDLMAVECSTEKKNGLTYVPWAEAWAKLKALHPDANYRILFNDDGGFLIGEGMVMTEVTVGEVSHRMWLPVMDFKNKEVKTPSTTDINKALMRCLTKNIAMHGIGLYPYMGEDLPVDDAKTTDKRSGARSSGASMTKADKAAIARAARGKDKRKVNAVYSRYGLIGANANPQDVDVKKVVADLKAI